MKRREGKAADLLVCFPTRAHLTLIPKPICSPARNSETKKNSHNLQQHRLKKFSNGASGGGGHGSPFLWSKNKQMESDISEPTSPKVTCAGQIKVRPKPGPCKKWQSVMEEIERLHNPRKEKKRPTWVEALGFKKEIMQFLTCLRSVRFHFRCFGSFPNADITSDEEDQEDEFPSGTREKQLIDHEASSRAVFSKWFMVLQENKEEGKLKEKACDNDNHEPCAPPSNALLLMRCRSAPAKSWLEEREDDNDDDDEEEEEEEEKRKVEEERAEKLGVEEAEKENKRESLMQMMRYETDFYKFSCDIAKETWVVGGIKNPLSRSQSWKR